MFKTIKSKIILITLSTFSVLLVIFSMVSYLYYRDTKSIMTDFASKSIASYVQNINKEVIKIEKNARDLAMMGELYYQFEKNQSVAEKTILQLFENYPESLGGGIWFKAYAIFPNKRLSCIYVYRNSDNKIVTDPSFESEAYNYLEQNWYKEILPQISKENNIEWSSPYFEKEGSDTLMITAGSGMYDNRGNLIGISTVDWAIDSVIKSIDQIKPTPGSFALFSDPEADYIIAYTDKTINSGELVGKSLKNISWYNPDLTDGTYIDYQNKTYIPYIKKLDNGMEIIVCVPKVELFTNIVKSVSILCMLLIIIAGIISLFLYSGLRNNIIKPIGKLIFIANKIGHGDDDVEIAIEKPEEFAKLASTFNEMTKAIKDITRESERINSELEVAKSIQLSSLPEVFPPFPERREFDIYASMTAAKEVGGDFYDFYFTDDNHFMFLIADVSGKGIPAALFMMTAKTLINSQAMIESDPKKLITQINKKLCANNKNGLFITMFAAIIDINTGEMSCINCGHNPPLIRQNNGDYKYMQINPNLVLGVIENANFEIYNTKLEPGETICLYTDGVTEALNSNGEMYGEENLLKCINSVKGQSIEKIVRAISADVNSFTGDITQSDDMTMLVYQYNGQVNYLEKCYKTLASQENYKNFYTWLHSVYSDWRIAGELANKIDMCAEEIYANVEFYAYGDSKGDLEVRMLKNGNKITIKFIDEGMQYNPLERPDPDITLPPEERPVGGLGVFMVKQIADKVSYKYENNKNILTLVIS